MILTSHCQASNPAATQCTYGGIPYKEKSRASLQSQIY